MKEITGYYVNPAENIAEERTIQDDLHTYYCLLDCSTIDICTRRIGGKWFSIVCDDEGLFRDDPIISAIDPDGRGCLVGSLFVVSAENNDGDLVGLSPQDINHLKKNTLRASTVKHPGRLFTMLKNVI